MSLQIVHFSPEYLPDYIRLNLEWIERFFKVEPHDIEHLEGAQEHILATGGNIFFALDGQEVVGCVALVKDTEDTYELAKMAVSPKHQCRGIGEALGRHVIAQVKQLGGKYLYLVSNQSLTPALTLYAKLGFKEIPMINSLYERGNYKAEMWISQD